MLLAFIIFCLLCFFYLYPRFKIFIKNKKDILRNELKFLEDKKKKLKETVPLTSPDLTYLEMEMDSIVERLEDQHKRDIAEEVKKRELDHQSYLNRALFQHTQSIQNEWIEKIINEVKEKMKSVDSKASFIWSLETFKKEFDKKK